MFRKLRRLIRKAQCRNGHRRHECTVTVYSDDTQRHIHKCLWCKAVYRDETKPLTPEVRELLAVAGILGIDPGMALSEQQRFH